MKAIKLSENQNNNDVLLSKEQKRFNKLVEKIQKCKVEIEIYKDFNDFLLQKGQELIYPQEQILIQCFKDFVLALNDSPYVETLRGNNKNKYKQMISEFSEKCIFEFGLEELQPIYDKYSKRTVEEIRQDENKMAFQMAQTLFKFAGVELTEEEFNSPEKMAEKMNALQEEKEAERKEEDEYRAAMREAQTRKKTTAQLNRETREQQAKQTLLKTTKQIYRDLVQNFHPDRELDEEKRQEKHTIMQEITTAYQENNFLKLLELQINLLNDRENAFGKFDDDQLKYFNNILKQQVEDLEYQKQEANPYENGNPFVQVHYSRFSKAFATDAFLKSQKEIIRQQNQLRFRINKMASQQGFKEIVQAY